MSLSLDVKNEQKARLTSNIAAAMRANDEESLSAAFAEFGEFVQTSIKQDAQEIGVAQAQDSTILAARGYRQLTSGEQSYYMGLGRAFRSDAPKMAISNMEAILPETVVEAVLQDIKKEHPLLDCITLQNTHGAAKIIVNVGGIDLAMWGKLTESKKQEVAASIKEIDVQALKLTAYIPVPKAMVDLGPVWLDAFIRAVLSEAVALGAENGVINGDGDDQPIGMIRKVGKNASVTGNKYAAKEAVKIPDFGVDTYGKLLAHLAVNSETGLTRDINEVILVCNPVDYFGKVMKSTTMLTSAGVYKEDLFPFPTRVIRSAAVPEGKAVFGIGRRYFLGMGTAKNGKLEYDDSVQFLDDNRVYMQKLYANGLPLDDNAFILLDISGLKELRYPVTTWTEAPDAAGSGASSSSGTTV